jgi:hypothetical protein
MGTPMLPVAFGTLLMVIWLGTPFYWGVYALKPLGSGYLVSARSDIFRRH